MASEKFRGKYRIDSARLKYYDYGSNGAYFITIVTKGREHFFGEIIDGKMKLSTIGEIAKDEWLKSPSIRPDMNLIMDDFIIMPNHMHGIIIIGDNQQSDSDVQTRCIASQSKSIASQSKSIARLTKGDLSKEKYQNKFGPQSKNLASILRGYKSSVTIQSRKILPSFGWQPRFHDSIVRDEKSLNRIKNYIINNPKNW